MLLHLTTEAALRYLSRAAMTLVSMRTLSMFMMLFMMTTITFTKRQQARRYAAIYGYDAGTNPFLFPMVMGFGAQPAAMELRRQVSGGGGSEGRGTGRGDVRGGICEREDEGR